MNTAMQKACDLIGAAKLSRKLGVSPQAINGWRTAGRPVPVARCVQIESVTNGAVTRKELRPDDWQMFWPELAESSDSTIQSTDIAA